MNRNDFPILALWLIVYAMGLACVSGCASTPLPPESGIPEVGNAHERLHENLDRMEYDLAQLRKVLGGSK